MNTLQYPILYSLPLLVLALLLPIKSDSILPWLMGTNAKASALVQRAGLQLNKQCSATGRLLSHSLCVNPFKEDTGKQQTAAQDVHLIVLIHGWMGNPKEMDGLKESLLEQSQLQLDQDKENNNKSYLSLMQQAAVSPRVVVHSIKCNDGRTSDGIVAGGQRVAQEINEVVQEIKSHSSSSSQNIQLSMVGNSLGGLYGRYAVSEIEWTNMNKENDSSNQQQQQQEGGNNGQVIPHYFVTTATPHLGCGYQQTYLPLPRFIEHPLGNIMLATGQDLFRLNNRRDIIQEMAFSPTFLRPLSKFHKRLSYANAHGTDFQVPLPSAAFWAPTDSVHTVVENNKDNDHFIVPKGVALTLTTARKVVEDEDSTLDTLTTAEPKNPVATAEEISKQLDQLGWTKVLIDVRHEMPINFNAAENPSDQKLEWTSKELLEQFDTGRLKSLPIGHMVMVANSKNEFYRNMCKSGIPIMDYLAKDIINSI